MMSPEDKAEILVAGWLSTHRQEYIPNGLNQLKEIIADAIAQERDRKLRGGPFVELPRIQRVIDLSRIGTMQIVPQGYDRGQEREVELSWWYDDPEKRFSFEMPKEKAEEIMALWKGQDRVPAAK